MLETEAVGPGKDSLNTCTYSLLECLGVEYTCSLETLDYHWEN